MMWVRALIISLLLCSVAAAARAQAPQVSMIPEQDNVLVGQPYVLRLELLVPTFMPRAPIFPTFEIPGLIVRLPERSTSPISRRIEGETWSGVQRTYRIYPMQAGITDIPPQQLSIVYRDVETNEDVALTIELPATRIVATVPPGARTLDPLILAQGLEIAQSWQMGEGELSVGDAVVRRLEISVSGASALFVPPLLEAAAPQSAAPGTAADDAPPIAGFLTYPEDAQVTETMELGVMSGTRIEHVSYIAQSGGTASFPQIVLSWYNLDTQEVEDIRLDGRTVSVAMPPRARTPMDLQAALWAVFLFALAGGLAWAAHRRLWPVVRPRLNRIRLAYDHSVHAAHRAAVASARANDLAGLVNALEAQSIRGHPPSRELEQAVKALTRAVYRDGKTGQEAAPHWQKIRQRLRRDRPGLIFKARGASAADLAPLNPFS